MRGRLEGELEEVPAVLALGELLVALRVRGLEGEFEEVPAAAALVELLVACTAAGEGLRACFPPDIPSPHLLHHRISCQ